MIQTLQRLADAIDVYEIDRVIARLDYHCRLLVNTTMDEQMGFCLIENAIESLNRDER